ncbi:MAG: hypothetical protein WBR18_15610 [Anaerolineales bacterium]
MSKRKRKSKPNIPEVTLRRFSASGAGKSTRVKGDHDFNPDYSYIIKDLRRIGVLAASFVGLLLVLSFLLN